MEPSQQPTEAESANTQEFQNFEDLARKIFAVPKSEVDKLEDEWREQQKEKKKNKPQK